MSEKHIPNLFVIGAQKAGTTSLYYYLKKHPDIFLTEKKELHFFSSKNETLDFDTYLAHFKHSQSYEYRGEISPSYLHVKGTAKRIYDFNPDAKLIVILREPVSRAFSNYIHLHRIGKETEKDFEIAFEKNKNSKKANNYIAKGLYYGQLKEYIDLFSSENILVMRHEDFQKNNERALETIQSFLGVKKADLIADYNHNTATLPKHSVLKPLFLLYSDFLAPTLKKWIPNKYLKSIKNQLTVPVEKIEEDKRLELFDKYYREDVDKLEKLVKMDFSKWYS